jgi:glycosyltransferase involved in cell wall biosynthesis
MHIVALTHLFHPARGGTEISLKEWAKTLAAKGHRLTVITSNQIALEDFRLPRPNPFLAREEVLEGIHIRRLALGKGRRWVLAKTAALALRSPIPRGERLWFRCHVPHLPNMIGEAAALRPDLLYAVPFPTATAYYAWAAARRVGCPWVLQPHLHFRDINPSLARILRWIAPKATAILTNTEKEKAFLVGLGVDEAKIHVTAQGVDLSALGKGDGRRMREALGLTGKKVLLFLGRKVEHKGWDTLLSAMPWIWREQPETALILAGQSSPYFQERFTLNPSAKDPRVVNLDDFPEKDKADLLAACDVLVLPSQAESFGVVFLEAWSQGKPVIGARIPAVEEMIHEGRDGLLVPYGDPKALAEKVLILLRDPELRRALGERGKEKVKERYGVERISAGLEDLFLKLVRP